MNGHDRRRQQISHRIQKTALELFKRQGVEETSMDAIAEQAGVSKVTIYKYYQSKDELFRQVIGLYLDEILAQTEALLAGDLDILTKLKLLMQTQASLPQLADSQELAALLDGPRGLQERIRGLMRQIYEQGQREGHIDPTLSFDLLTAYTDILTAGFQARSKELGPILADPKSFEQLQQLFFFGFLRKN
jgi:AcrR family transcriptional regulator